jgi:signal transduction histidine kinase
MELTKNRLDALARAAAALAGELTLDGVLEAIAESAAVTTGARYAALGVIGPGETISRFITHGASQETIDEIGHYPTGKGLLGLLIRDPRIIRLEDISAHPASSGFPAHHPPMGNFLGAPVRSGGRVYGNLYLTEKDGGFTPTDEYLIALLAAQAGAAIENALLSERLQSVAVQHERDRISRDLHDGVIQRLFSIGMSLESARALITADPVRADDRVSSAVDGIDDAIRELRNHIFQLRPHQSALMGLSRGLTELAREHEVNALVRPQLAVSSAVDATVPGSVVPDLLQVVREALSNVAKHAHARSVELRCELHGTDVLLEVRDDGRGYEPDAARVGHGLDNIAERANAIGATFVIDSAPGHGTLVRLTVPLEGAAT